MNLGWICRKGDVSTGILEMYMVQTCGYGIIMENEILGKRKHNDHIHRGLKLTCV